MVQLSLTMFKSVPLYIIEFVVDLILFRIILVSMLLAAVSYIDGTFWDRTVDAAKDEFVLDQLFREYMFSKFT